MSDAGLVLVSPDSPGHIKDATAQAPGRARLRTPPAGSESAPSGARHIIRPGSTCETVALAGGVHTGANTHIDGLVIFEVATSEPKRISRTLPRRGDPLLRWMAAPRQSSQTSCVQKRGMGVNAGSRRPGHVWVSGCSRARAGLRQGVDAGTAVDDIHSGAAVEKFCSGLTK